MRKAQLRAHKDAALFQVGELLDALHFVSHPSEFGMDGCPICAARDDVRDALDSLNAAVCHLRLEGIE